jgi:4-amino-4-deoxy-L-arabinose transferase-like glycosyltransferase
MPLIVVLVVWLIADRGFQNAFASLPLSLLPTYIVPLVMASHALIFYQSTRSDRVA